MRLAVCPAKGVAANFGSVTIKEGNDRGGKPENRGWQRPPRYSELPPQITSCWPVMAPPNGPSRKPTNAATSSGLM